MRRWVCSGRPASVSSGFAKTWATFGGNAGAPGEDSGAERGTTPKVGRWPRTTPGSSVGGARERYPRRRSSAPHLRGRERGGRGMMSATRTRPRRWKKRTGERDGNARGVGGGTNPGCAASSSSYIASGGREAPPHARGARAKPLPAAVNTSRKSRDGAAGPYWYVRLEIKFQSRRVSYSSSR